MAPSLRLLAYYVNTETSEILVDSVWVDVENICENNVSLMRCNDFQALYTVHTNTRTYEIPVFLIFDMVVQK